MQGEYLGDVLEDQHGAGCVRVRQWRPSTRSSISVVAPSTRSLAWCFLRLVGSPLTAERTLSRITHCLHRLGLTTAVRFRVDAMEGLAPAPTQSDRGFGSEVTFRGGVEVVNLNVAIDHKGRLRNGIENRSKVLGSLFPRIHKCTLVRADQFAKQLVSGTLIHADFSLIRLAQMSADQGKATVPPSLDKIADPRLSHRRNRRCHLEKCR